MFSPRLLNVLKVAYTKLKQSFTEAFHHYFYFLYTFVAAEYKMWRFSMLELENCFSF